MNMRMLEDLHYKLCKELEEIAGKGELGAGDLEIVHKLTDTIKNIDKIKCYDEMEKGEYSQRGGSRGGNSYRGNSYDGGDMGGMNGGSYNGGNSGYNGGNSGARRGEHYVRGHYSRGSDSEHIADELREMMDKADDGQIRRALEKAIRAIEE